MYDVLREQYTLAQYAKETVAYGCRFTDGFWATGEYFGFHNIPGSPSTAT